MSATKGSPADRLSPVVLEAVINGDRKANVKSINGAETYVAGDSSNLRRSRRENSGR